MSEYILVDGREWYVRRQMSQEQFEEADRVDRLVHDNQLWWEPVNKQNSQYPENQDGWWNEGL